MYYEHFGLAHPPFKITPDTRLFYEGGKRGDILDALAYAITSGEGIVKVVGEVGSGKTMLSRMLAVKLPDHVDIAYFANPNLAPEDILYAIAVELKIELPRDVDRIQALHMLQQTLLERHAQGRQVVCFVEEAQAMPLETLEEIRLLSNLETHVAKLLQIVLFGQPELDENLDEPRIRQLRERIVHSFYLDPLGTMDVSSYVNFRMRAVGYRGPDVFTKGAYRVLSRASEGLIRRINIIGDKALLAAYADNSHQVTAKHVRTAIRDSEFGRVNAARRAGPSIGSRIGIAAAVLVAVAVGWLAGTDTPVTSYFRHVAGLTDATSAGATSAGATAEVAATPVAATPVPAAPVSAAPVASAQSQPVSAPVVATPAPATPAPATPAAVAPAAPVAAAPVPAAPAPAPAPAPERAVVADTAPVSRVAAPSVRAPAAPPTPQAVLTAPRVVGAQDAVAPDPLLATSEAQALVLAGFGSDAGLINEPALEPITMSVPPASPPAAPAPLADGGALLQARLAATLAWLQGANGDHFSIQLMLANQNERRNLEAFLERWQSERNVSELYVYRTNIRGALWYGVLFKEYPSIQAAKQALDAMPPALKRYQPFIRNIRDIDAIAALEDAAAQPRGHSGPTPLSFRVAPGVDRQG